jgi:ABC-type sulfate transport system permease component
VSQLLNAGSGMDQYLVYYNPLVAEKIEVLDLYVYRLGLVKNDYSLATAVGIMKSIVSIILLFSVNFTAKKTRGEGIVLSISNSVFQREMQIMKKPFRPKLEWIIDIVNHIVLTLFFLITLYPFYYVFIYSISDSSLAQNGVVLLPQGFSLESYKRSSS